jgi:hypothetical protein
MGFDWPGFSWCRLRCRLGYMYVVVGDVEGDAEGSERVGSEWSGSR